MVRQASGSPEIHCRFRDDPVAEQSWAPRHLKHRKLGALRPVVSVFCAGWVLTGQIDELACQTGQSRGTMIYHPTLDDRCLLGVFQCFSSASDLLVVTSARELRMGFHHESMKLAESVLRRVMSVEHHVPVHSHLLCLSHKCSAFLSKTRQFYWMKEMDARK